MANPGVPPPQQPPPYKAHDPAYPPQPFPEVTPNYQPAPSSFPRVQQHQATVVVTQPVVVQRPAFRDYPVTVIDSNGDQVTTELHYESGTLTWVIVAVLCVVGLGPLALIPFCIDETKDVYHITPTDGKVVGVYKRMSL